MKKLRSCRGMTLTEMLCSVVIVLLFSSLVAVGAGASARTYRSGMASAQAQVLESTVTAAVSDKLRYCGSVSFSEDGSQIFIQDIGKVDGSEEGGIFTLTDGQLYLGENKLLGAKSYPQGLRLADFHMTYSEGSGVFAVSFRVTDGKDRTLADASFEVERINH